MARVIDQGDPERGDFPARADAFLAAIAAFGREANALFAVSPAAPAAETSPPVCQKCSARKRSRARRSQVRKGGAASHG